MTDQEALELVESACNGDEQAFHGIVREFRPAVTSYIRRYIPLKEDVEDLTQETFLSAYLSMRSGGYKHINRAAFAGWLRKIAWRGLINRPGRGPEQPEENLADRADAGRPLTETLVDTQLFEFMSRQFGEVFMGGDKIRQSIGLLKKMAFLFFYVDGLSQRETVTAILAYASRIGVTTEVDRITVNNWISRGDILKQLVRHLVEEHHELLSKLTDPKVCEALTPLERRLLERHWDQNQGAEALAAEFGLPVPEVRRALKRAREEVTMRLFRMIKKELHDARYQDSRNSGGD
jgi:RNA polymerase sigma factor (sigma-70 family)